MPAGALPSGAAKGRGAADLVEVEVEVESPIVVGWAAVEFFGTGWEKKTKDNTPARAVRAIKAMATVPIRLFIFCLTT